MKYVVLAACCLGLLLGCTPAGPTKHVTKGTVELDGQPLAEGDMTFVPRDDKGRAEGAKIADGKWSVPIADGAYTVKIIATKKVPLGPGEPSVSGEKDKLVSIIPAKYNEKSDLTLTVSGPTEVPPFKLQSK